MTDGNPIITDVYTSDPAVLVHDGTAYLYTGHDEAPPDADRFVMHDWLCWSSTDLRSWTPHGPLLRVDDFAWARDGAKASCVVERHGRFWWYLAMNHATVPGGAIGVGTYTGGGVATVRITTGGGVLVCTIGGGDTTGGGSTG